MAGLRGTIKAEIKLKLWLMSSGRCQYQGCNEILWQDALTLAKLNKAHIAHIHGVEPTAARHDSTMNATQVNDFSNLMLACQTHHRLIDHEGKDDPEHSAPALRAMKKAHEDRIRLVTSFKEDSKSEVLRYGKAIGEGQPVITMGEVYQAMKPRYRESENGVSICLLNQMARAYDDAFWSSEAAHLRQCLNQQLRERIRLGQVTHLSVFAIAPQPLLILLGHLISGMVPTEVHHRIKRTETWGWLPGSIANFDFIIKRPDRFDGPPALVLSLSGSIESARITRCFDGQPPSIWEITIPNPSTDFLLHRHQLDRFCVVIRELLDEIKIRHGHNSELHVFPAAPVSINVELGRQHKDTADLPMALYNEDPADRRFKRTLAISLQQA